MKIKTGDNVIVITGEFKGKTGKVLKVFPSKNMVLVEGINVCTRHTKPSQKNPNGSVKDVTHPIDASNVSLFDEESKKPVKVGYKMVNEKKVRYLKKSGKVLD